MDIFFNMYWGWIVFVDGEEEGKTMLWEDDDMDKSNELEYLKIPLGNDE